MLTSRCRFEVSLEDASGSTKGIFMDEEAEQLLSLTADEIYTRALTEVHSDTGEHDHPQIQDTLFKIKVKKSFPRNARTCSARVLILAIDRNGSMLPSGDAPSSANIPQRNKRPNNDAMSPNDETAERKVKPDTRWLKVKMEPPTPGKLP